MDGLYEKWRIFLNCTLSRVQPRGGREETVMYTPICKNLIRGFINALSKQIFWSFKFDLQNQTKWTQWVLLEILDF
jgi:hypothetical protein